MRLISQLEKLEAGAAAARNAAPVGVAIAWSTRAGVEVVRESLQYGDYVAVDIRIQGGPAAERGVIPDACSTPPARWIITERVTRDPQDLGVVYDASGARIGLVMGIDGRVISTEADQPGRRALPGMRGVCASDSD